MYVLFVIAGLSVPIGKPNRDPEWLDFRRFPARRMAADAVLNVALFVPLGWALHRAARAAGLSRAAILVAALGSAGLSVGLETLQYFLAYRFSSLLDVATNVAGAVGGALVDRASSRL